MTAKLVCLGSRLVGPSAGNARSVAPGRKRRGGPLPQEGVAVAGWHRQQTGCMRAKVAVAAERMRIGQVRALLDKRGACASGSCHYRILWIVTKHLLHAHILDAHPRRTHVYSHHAI